MALRVLQVLEMSGITHSANELQRKAPFPDSPPRSKVSDTLSPQPATTDQTASVTHFDRSAGARILARSFYKELRSSGYTPKQLLALSTELIDLITQDLQHERKGAA